MKEHAALLLKLRIASLVLHGIGDVKWTRGAEGAETGVSRKETELLVRLICVLRNLRSSVDSTVQMQKAVAGHGPC